MLAMLLSSITGQAQNDQPALEHVMDLNVNIGQSINVGKTPHGNRNIVPITGGTFQGTNIKGTILNGGADYQMMTADGSRNDLEAIYNICTDDGVNIHIRNKGIAMKDYFYCSPTFEAPSNSKYAWLNNAIFICRPIDFKKNSIVLRVWKVCDKK